MSLSQKKRQVLHMDVRIPTLKIKILLESNPLKSRILVQRLAVLPMPWLHPPLPARRDLQSLDCQKQALGSKR